MESTHPLPHPSAAIPKKLIYFVVTNKGEMVYSLHREVISMAYENHSIFADEYDYFHQKIQKGVEKYALYFCE